MYNLNWLYSQCSVKLSVNLKLIPPNLHLPYSQFQFVHSQFEIVAQFEFVWIWNGVSQNVKIEKIQI